MCSVVTELVRVPVLGHLPYHKIKKNVNLFLNPKNLKKFKNSPQERKLYEVGCKYSWNILTNQFRITHVLPLKELKTPRNPTSNNVVRSIERQWNPTRFVVQQWRSKSEQPYARTVRFLQHRMGLGTY